MTISGEFGLCRIIILKMIISKLYKSGDWIHIAWKGNQGKVFVKIAMTFRDSDHILQHPSTVELHLSGLIGVASHLDMQKIQVIGFFFENRLHWPFAVRLLLFTLCVWV